MIRTLPFFLLAGSVALTGCASMQYSASSESDGRVTVAYLAPVAGDGAMAMQRANQVATRQCARSGFAYTARDVQVTQQCVASDAAGNCAEVRVASTFQCAGGAMAEPQYLPALVSLPVGGTSR